MAGHSKWANIKHKKAKEDAKRGKAFTKLSKEITVVARMSGGDPAGNPRLRHLMDKGRAINMPLENITRAIKKGTGELPGVNYEEMLYEGYGPHGIAVLLEILTDNRNRTAGEMRRLFSINGGSLGETGSVAWMFEKQGVIRASGETTEDALLEHLIDFDISDISQDESTFTIHCDARATEQVRKSVENMGLKIETAELEWVAKNSTELPDDQAEAVYEFLSELDDHDDVQNVYSNLA